MAEPRHEFAQREARLRQLAAGHPMHDYLLFVAAIAHAQHQLAATWPAQDVADPAQIAANIERTGAAWPADRWPRDSYWRQALRAMLCTLAPQLELAARDSVQRLLAASDTTIESQADRLLNGITVGLDLAAAPLIAAALQVHWMRCVSDAAQRHGSSIFERRNTLATCPCCGCRPTASVVRAGGAEHGYRYLHCALCSTQWHLVRIRCGSCLGTKGIHYQSLEAIDPARGTGSDRVPVAAVRAECCSECRHYLKILSMEKDHELEPVADDLGTVALDLLVSEAGYQSAGLNLMLLYGDPGGG